MRSNGERAECRSLRADQVEGLSECGLDLNTFSIVFAQVLMLSAGQSAEAHTIACNHWTQERFWHSRRIWDCDMVITLRSLTISVCRNHEKTYQLLCLSKVETHPM